MLATLLSSAGNHALLKGPVGDETLDLVYGGVCVVVGAVALKLAGMRAIAAAGRGEGFAALDKPVGALCLPAANALRGGRFGNTGHDFHAVLFLHVHVEVAAVTGIIYVEHSKLPPVHRPARVQARQPQLWCPRGVGLPPQVVALWYEKSPRILAVRGAFSFPLSSLAKSVLDFLRVIF